MKIPCQLSDDELELPDKLESSKLKGMLYKIQILNYDGSPTVYIKKEDIQNIINHLTEVLKNDN